MIITLTRLRNITYIDLNIQLEAYYYNIMRNYDFKILYNDITVNPMDLSKIN